MSRTFAAETAYPLLMGNMLDPLLRDLRSTTRMLAARPGWTVAAILCLAIATGANTAAFTLVNGLLLRPLPFDEPEQLVMVAFRDPKRTSTRPFSLHEYRELADQSNATSTLLARTFFPLSLAGEDGARMAQAELVSGNYFETLRVTPLVGRFFDEGSDRPGSTPLAVLSHRLWQLRFGANAAVIGQSVRVNGRPVVVAGVAPPGFVGAMHLVAADLWLPAAMYPDLAGSAGASTIPMSGIMGRLATGGDGRGSGSATHITVRGHRGRRRHADSAGRGRDSRADVLKGRGEARDERLREPERDDRPRRTARECEHDTHGLAASARGAVT